jgi:rhomboid protease GluP
MSQAVDPTAEQNGRQDASSGVQVRIPLVKPIVTYVLLAANVICFAIEAWLAGLYPSIGALEVLGAQSNKLVAAGEYWRLGTAMFMHAEPAHLAFNMYALFILGRDIEGFYGHLRFAAIYLLCGIAGNVASYVLAAAGLVSVGASGAIFGLIGAEIALLASNRLLFGSSRRPRLLNLAFLVGINLVYGFANPRINNLAHLGGLAAGLALGFALTPRHQVAREWSPAGPVPRLVDGTPRWLQVAAVSGACLLLGLAVWLR